MNAAEIILNQIDNQISANNGKNIFYQGEDFSIWFAEDTIKLLGTLEKLNKQEEETLIDQLTNKALKEFYRVNQYYSFDEFHQIALRNIYRELFDSIKKMNGVFEKRAIENLSKNHSRRLTTWLVGANSFAWKIYSPDKEYIEPVACSEYSAEIQMEILRVDPLQLLEPILDIGCGSKATLVKYLCDIGYEAYGFDRISDNAPNLENADWLNFEFGNRKWGTIISNQGFSNHFRHHHLRNDGDFISYSKKYVEIINSLKPGGSFHYAPGLPFIEQYLDPSKFNISVAELGQYSLNSVRILRTI
jgi:hypothetical protein